MTSQNRNYPTRMHEVLGVEVDEEATYKSTTKELKDFRFFVDEYGSPRYPSRRLLDGYDMANIINHPERIVRKPRLSEEQVKQLNAALLLGFKWLTVNSVDELWLFGTKPRKFSLGWGESEQTVARLTLGNHLGLSRLVSWSDPEPLDIVQTLEPPGGEGE